MGTEWGRNGGGTGRSFNSRFGAKTRHDACGGMTARRPSPRETRTRRGAAPSKDRRRPQAAQSAFGGDRRKTGAVPRQHKPNSEEIGERQDSDDAQTKGRTTHGSVHHQKGHTVKGTRSPIATPYYIGIPHHERIMSTCEAVRVRRGPHGPQGHLDPTPTEGCDGKLAVKS